LEIPTGYAYLAVPVAALLIGLTSLANMWEWRQAGRGRNQTETYR
jgi:TRAP-type C4-dicarboxylate transport system permease small subunit